MPSETPNESQKSDNLGVKVKSKRPVSHFVGKRHNTARDRSVSFGSDSSPTSKHRAGIIKGNL